MVVRYNQDGTVDVAASRPAPIVTPAPINALNPWFGKKPKPVDAFWGLLMFNLRPARIARCLNDPAFAAIERIINANDLIDPDDKDGDFLFLVAYLTDGASASIGQAGAWTVPVGKLNLYKAQGAEYSPLASDGQSLLTVAEINAIMGAW